MIEQKVPNDSMKKHLLLTLQSSGLTKKISGEDTVLESLVLGGVEALIKNERFDATEYVTQQLVRTQEKENSVKAPSRDVIGATTIEGRPYEPLNAADNLNPVETFSYEEYKKVQ